MLDLCIGNMSGLTDGQDDLEVVLGEDDDDILLLDEFDNDDTEDVSLCEKLDAKIKVEQSDTNTRLYPDGWSFNRKSSRLISPSGEVFSSRRAALKAMVNSEKYTIGEIEQLRSVLRHEGWRESNDLPRCWMIRDGNDGPEILGAGGEFFKTLTEAAKFIEQYEEYFYQEDLKNFWIFVKNTTQKNSESEIGRETSGDFEKGWKTEPFIPAGWKIKECSGFEGARLYLLRTSNGKLLPGKRRALKYMVKENYPNKDVERIRESIKTDGFNTLKSLPPNWLYKQTKSKPYFIDPIGNVFDSMENVTKILKSSLNFDLNEFINSVEKTSSTETQSRWIRNDPTVPKGWMTREYRIGKVKTKKLFSPNDQIFQSRRMALKFMVENQYPVDQIEEMRENLKHDNWHPDTSLPEKWLYQKNKSGGYSYINQNGLYFKNKIDILASLEKNADLSFLNNFLRKKKKGEEINVIRSSLIADGWNPDESLPDKWLYKKIGKTNFINEDGLRLRQRLEAIKYLRQKGRYEDILKVNKFILRSRKNSVWKKKRKIKVPSLKQEDEICKQREIKVPSLKKEDEICKQKEIKTEEWIDLEGECLKGWKLMIYASGSKHYKTPSGEVLRNKPHIMTFLKNKNVDEETVSAIMEGISKIAYKRKRNGFRAQRLKA